MNTLSVIRRWLLAVLALGLVGTSVELVLLEHYETAVQWVPLVAIALALAVLIWHGVKGDALSIRALQATMVLFLAAGVAGMGLHLRGSAEFQLEIDPSLEPLGDFQESDALQSAARTGAWSHGAARSRRTRVRVPAPSSGRVRAPLFVSI